MSAGEHGSLVAGLGNEYRSDDGAGPAVAAYVSERMSKVVSKVISEPLDLIGAWDDADLAVVVDATRSDSPGTVQFVDLGTGEDSGSSAGPMSSHGWICRACSGSRGRWATLRAVWSLSGSKARTSPTVSVSAQQWSSQSLKPGRSFSR